MSRTSSFSFSISRNSTIVGLLFSALMGSAILDLGACTISARTDSEAASEAGSEAGGVFWRGRRYYDMQKLNQRKEMVRERKEKRQEMRQKRKAANEEPEIREYGRQNRQRRNRFNQTGQQGLGAGRQPGLQRSSNAANGRAVNPAQTNSGSSSQNAGAIPGAGH